jgi:hypothetical protein
VLTLSKGVGDEGEVNEAEKEHVELLEAGEDAPGAINPGSQP